MVGDGVCVGDFGALDGDFMAYSKGEKEVRMTDWNGKESGGWHEGKECVSDHCLGWSGRIGCLVFLGEVGSVLD